jgi:hypothetical protein
MYKWLSEVVLRRVTDPTSSGKRIVLLSTFVHNYQDVMAILWLGRISKFLKRFRLKPEDRPDLVIRLFKIKLNDLLKEIKKSDVFGKVKSGISY